MDQNQCLLLLPASVMQVSCWCLLSQSQSYTWLMCQGGQRRIQGQLGKLQAQLLLHTYKVGQQIAARYVCCTSTWFLCTYQSCKTPTLSPACEINMAAASKSCAKMYLVAQLEHTAKKVLENIVKHCQGDIVLSQHRIYMEELCISVLQRRRTSRLCGQRH